MEHLEHFEDYRRTRARTYTSIEEEVFQVFQVPAAAAVDQKVEQIREFVRWWDDTVTKNKGARTDLNAVLRFGLDDAESLTGISQQQVSRWHVVVALLRAPAAESRRLGKLLTRWPATVRRHLLVDDVRRRLWKRGNA